MNMTTSMESKIFTSADGTPIYAESLGDQCKPAIVFIHGLFFHSIAYDNVFEDPRWTEHVYLVRYDCRGHGRSGKPEDPVSWESKRHYEDFEAVVKGFGLRRPFVAGWSMGGTHICDILSFHRPSDLAGIVYIAAVPSLNLMHNIVYPSTVIQELAQTTDVPTFQAAANTFVSTLTTPSNSLPHYMHLAFLGCVTAMPHAVFAVLLSRKQNDEGLFRAGREDGLPLLAVYGTEDQSVDGNAVMGYFEGWKDLEVVDVVSGHMPWYEQSDEVRSKILSWVGKRSA